MPANPAGEEAQNGGGEHDRAEDQQERGVQSGDRDRRGGRDRAACEQVDPAEAGMTPDAFARRHRHDSGDDRGEPGGDVDHPVRGRGPGRAAPGRGVASRPGDAQRSEGRSPHLYAAIFFPTSEDAPGTR